MADRLTLILWSLHDVLCACARWRPQLHVVWLGTAHFVAPAPAGPHAPVAPETWALLRDRAGRAIARLVGLFARWQAGTLPPPRHDFPRPKRAPNSRPARAGARLPRGRAWVAARVFEVRGCASQLQHLLAEPEFGRFLAASPQAGRLLRPLCHAIGTELPPALALPRRLRPTPRSMPRETVAAGRRASPPPDPIPPAPTPPDRPLPDRVRRTAKAWKKVWDRNDKSG